MCGDKKECVRIYKLAYDLVIDGLLGISFKKNSSPPKAAKKKLRLFFGKSA